MIEIALSVGKQPNALMRLLALLLDMNVKDGSPSQQIARTQEGSLLQESEGQLDSEKQALDVWPHVRRYAHYIVQDAAKLAELAGTPSAFSASSKNSYQHLDLLTEEADLNCFTPASGTWSTVVQRQADQ